MALDRTKPWLPTGPPPDLLLVNGRIIDINIGSIRHGSIHIRGTEIDTVAISDTPSSVPAIIPGPNTKVIDLEGGYVLPGLIDCHVHLLAGPGSSTVGTMFDTFPSTLHYRAVHAARSMLLRGFTTARDTGGADAGLKNAIAEYLVAGPRLFISGKALSQTGGHGDKRQTWEGDATKCCGGIETHGLGRVCDGVPSCTEAARDELRQGADFLKIMVGGGVASPTDPLEMLQFLPEEIRAITATAKMRGTYVTAHAYTNEAIRHAVGNGVEGIEHGNFIDEETAKWCKEQEIRAITPTLITYKAMSEPPWEEFLPVDGRVKNRKVLEQGLTSLKIWKDAGVMICFGSDLLAGMQSKQNNEFTVRSQAMNPLEILRSATINGARLLGMEGKIGVVDHQAFADLVIVKADTNPLEDIGVLDRMEETCLAILKEGRVVMSKIDKLDVDDVYRMG